LKAIHNISIDVNHFHHSVSQYFLMTL